MDALEQEATAIFKDSGALLQGHFVLRSGLHSEWFFQCATVGQRLDRVTRLAALLLQRLNEAGISFETVLAPAMGGLVIGQEVARQAGARYLFAEKVSDRLALRRNFRIAEKESILVVEDVVTRGGRVREALEIIEQTGGVAKAVAALVDRSDGKASFGVPFIPLVRMSFPTYEPDQLPDHLAATVPQKPGS